MDATFQVLVTAAHWAPSAQDIVRGAGGQITFLPDPVTEDLLAARLAATGARALVLRGSKPISARVLAAAPALKIVAKNGAGVDSVDLAAARQRGVAVAVAPAANADAVAEHALALMLSLTRQLPLLDGMVRGGLCRRNPRCRPRRRGNHAPASCCRPSGRRAPCRRAGAAAA